MAKVTEHPQEEGQTLADQDSRRRVFDVQAVSSDDALAVLAREKGVYEHAPYADVHGVIDFSLVAQQLIVASRSVAAVGATRLWRIEVNYNRGSEQEDPKHKTSPAVYLWGRAEQSVELEKDLSGNWVTNSRDQLYEPPPTVVVAHRTLTIKWVVGAYNLSDLLQYDSVANSDDWHIAGRWKILPGQALSHGIDPQPKNENLTQLVWSIEFKPGGALWQPLKLPDYFIDGQGNRIPLDGSGNVAATPAELSFDAYETKPFAAWGV